MRHPHALLCRASHHLDSLDEGRITSPCARPSPRWVCGRKRGDHGDENNAQPSRAVRDTTCDYTLTGAAAPYMSFSSLRVIGPVHDEMHLVKGDSLWVSSPRVAVSGMSSTMHGALDASWACWSSFQ